MGLLAEKSCTRFTSLLASKAPTPGGGGASALMGALSAALCSMAGNLTVGKKKYAENEPKIREIISACERIRTRMLELIDEDAAAFEPLSQAYSMDKNDPAYAETMYKVSMDACDAPYKIMRLCCDTIDLISDAAPLCSKLVLSDVGCAAAAAIGALQAAALNVLVNTKGFPNTGKVAALEAETYSMLNDYVRKAASVYNTVLRSMGRE